MPLAEALSHLIDESRGSEAPVSKERAVLTTIPVETITVEGPGLEIAFRFVEDEIGEYTEITFDFSRYWNFSSPPIIIKDRRPELTALARENQVRLELLRKKRTNLALNRELQQASELLTSLIEASQVSDEISAKLETDYTWILKKIDQIEAVTEYTQAMADDLEELMAARAVIEERLLMLDPNHLETKIRVLEKKVKALKSQLEQHPLVDEVEIPEATGSTSLREVFCSMGALFKKVKTTDKITEQVATTYELLPLPTDYKSGGSLSFESNQIKLPKALASPAEAMLVRLHNILLSGSDSWLQKRMAQEENSDENTREIIHAIAYSSGSGRHQGRAVMRVVPPE